MSSCPTLDQPGKVHGKASLGAKLNKRRQSQTHNDTAHAKIRPRGSSPGLGGPALMAVVALLGWRIIYLPASQSGWTLGWVYLGLLAASIFANLACLSIWNPVVLRDAWSGMQDRRNGTSS